MRTQRILRSFPANIVVGMKPGMTERLDVAHRLSTTRPTPAFAHSQFGSIEAGKSASAAFCKTWEEEVKRVVPKDRLLVRRSGNDSLLA